MKLLNNTDKNSTICWYNKLLEELILFIIFGLIYASIEIIYRGYTHFSMVILGGICGVLIGLINDNTPDMPMCVQCILGAMIVTALEFFFGVYLNLYLGLNVWDYTNVRFNYLGQICLPFSACWFFLSYLAVEIDDYIKYLIRKRQAK